MAENAFDSMLASTMQAGESARRCAQSCARLAIALDRRRAGHRYRFERYHATRHHNFACTDKLTGRKRNVCGIVRQLIDEARTVT